MKGPRTDGDKLMRALIGIQWAWAIFIAIVSFGFDHLSSLRLDFDHFTKALLILVGLSLAAVTVALWKKHHIGLFLSVIPVAGWLGLFLLQ